MTPVHPVWRRLAVLAIPIGALTAWHVREATRKGEPLWVPLVGLVLMLGILGAVGGFMSRPVAGLDAKAAWKVQSSRSSGVVRWAVILSSGIALLRLIVLLSERR